MQETPVQFLNLGRSAGKGKGYTCQYSWASLVSQLVKNSSMGRPGLNGASASASVLSVTIQGWFPLGLTAWISLQSKGLSSILQHHSSKTSILWRSAFFMVQLSHPYTTTGKTIALTIQTLVSKMMSLLFNTLSRFAIDKRRFAPSKEQLSFNFMSTVTVQSDFGAQENIICHSFHFFPFYLPWSDGAKIHIICTCTYYILYIVYLV